MLRGKGNKWRLPGHFLGTLEPWTAHPVGTDSLKHPHFGDSAGHSPGHFEPKAPERLLWVVDGLASLTVILAQTCQECPVSSERLRHLSTTHKNPLTHSNQSSLCKQFREFFYHLFERTASKWGGSEQEKFKRGKRCSLGGWLFVCLFFPSHLCEFCRMSPHRSVSLSFAGGSECLSNQLHNLQTRNPNESLSHFSLAYRGRGMTHVVL